MGVRRFSLAASIAAAAIIFPGLPAASATAAPSQPAASGPAISIDNECEMDGPSFPGDTDCVTLRVASDTWVPNKGEKVKLRGKVHSSVELKSGTKVVIQRAADGGMWFDLGDRWRKVKVVKVRENGTFKANVDLHRFGSHTFRAKIAKKNFNMVVMSSGDTQQATKTTRSGASLRPLTAVSDSAQATVGVAYYAMEFYNYTEYDQQISCRALAGARYSGASGFTTLPRAYTTSGSVNGPYRCVFPIIPGKGGMFIAGTFQIQAYKFKPIYSFYPKYSHWSDARQCSNTRPSGSFSAANFPIKPNDIIRVDLAKGRESIGEQNDNAGTMNFSNGVQCVFGLYEDGYTDTETVIGNIGWADIQGNRTWFMPASDWDSPLPGLPKDTVGYLFIAERGLNADDFKRFTEATASDSVELSNDLWSTRYAIDSGPADIRV